MFTQLRCYIVAKRTAKQMRNLAKLRDQLHSFNKTLREEVIPTMTVLREGEATFDAIALAYGQVTKASLELAEQRSKDRK